jgi:hypothetical protein
MQPSWYTGGVLKRPCPDCGQPVRVDVGECPGCGANLRVVTAGDEGLVSRDQEHLRLLVIFHYVYSGLCALGGTIPIFHFVMGLVFLISPESVARESEAGAASVALIGWMFTIIGGAFVLVGWTKAVLVFLGARSMARRRRYGLCMVAAGVCCIGVPLGTVLGVFTFIVLARPSVRSLWNS